MLLLGSWAIYCKITTFNIYVTALCIWWCWWLGKKAAPYLNGDGDCT